jgi:hypothetical protein
LHSSSGRNHADAETGWPQSASCHAGAEALEYPLRPRGPRIASVRSVGHADTTVLTSSERQRADSLHRPNAADPILPPATTGDQLPPRLVARFAVRARPGPASFRSPAVALLLGHNATADSHRTLPRAYHRLRVPWRPHNSKPIIEG